MEQSIDMVPMYAWKSVQGKVVYADLPDYGKETVQVPCVVRWPHGDEKCIVAFDSHEEYEQSGLKVAS